MASLMRYPGSKWGLADWVVSHFPEGYEKMVYLEPFFGSGAVFFTKRPSVVETINDLDGDIVNLFRCLREKPEELRRALELTPYSREEYDRAFEPCEDMVERARRFMVENNQSIGAKRDGKCGWRNHKQAKVGGTACKWTGIPAAVSEAASRLRGTPTNLVQIERMDALRLIERYNSPEVLMYLDPPYVRETRRAGRLYRNEMTDGDHRRMIDALRHTRAKVVLSGYLSPLYEQINDGELWYMDTTESIITSGEVSTECLWTNYQPPFEQMKLEV